MHVCAVLHCHLAQPSCAVMRLLPFLFRGAENALLSAKSIHSSMTLTIPDLMMTRRSHFQYLLRRLRLWVAALHSTTAI
jgi:hypothetical protein